METNHQAGVVGVGVGGGENFKPKQMAFARYKRNHEFLDLLLSSNTTTSTFLASKSVPIVEGSKSVWEERLAVLKGQTEALEKRLSSVTTTTSRDTTSRDTTSRDTTTTTTTGTAMEVGEGAVGSELIRCEKAAFDLPPRLEKELNKDLLSL